MGSGDRDTHCNILPTVSLNADVCAGIPKLTTLRGHLTLAGITGNLVAFGDCHSAFHTPPIPRDSEPVYVEPVPEANVQHSKVGLCKKAFQGLTIWTAER